MPTIPPLPQPSLTVWAGFLILSLIMAAAAVAAVWRTSGRTVGIRAFVLVAAWAGLSAGLAASGFLDHWAPPRIAIVLAVIAALLIWTARSDWGARLGDLPLQLLVGFQAFRILVELLIHQAVTEGLAPASLTWTGFNLDIIPAVTALALAPIATRLPRILLFAWNLGAAATLGVTVFTALAAAPTPFQFIHSNIPNTWVTRFPFVWLPAILVAVALVGHVVLYRRLRRDAASRPLRTNPSLGG
ncbi:MAG: hypothetical protein R3F39_12535 [Myxococcota bacterium]